ncbi:MAG: DUF456 domain-containing protein [Anaerolineales bacterium]|nr:DUF456 domain-containing protein [Anaerolineales bacterium]
MPEWLKLTSDTLVYAMVLTFMFLGLGVLVVPILPGLVIIWAAALGYGIYAGFGTLGWIMFAIMTVLMIAGSFADNLLMATQSRKQGASWLSIGLALLAALLGNFLFPILGGILAAIGTLYLAEWVRLKDSQKAFTTMKGMMVGCGWAFVIRFIIGLVMIGLWMIWAWT